MSSDEQAHDQNSWTAPPADMPGPVAHPSDEAQRERDLEAWDNTDRPLEFSAPFQSGNRSKCFTAHAADPARERWLQKNNVRTEFLDAGIGCCWFAQHGEDEPVAGETEYDAIVRLAREKGLELWPRSNVPLAHSN
jgi:hypothetical protein